MDDLISRQAAIDALKRLQKDISGDYTELDPMVMAGCGYIGDCIGEIQDMPSVQPELDEWCHDCKEYDTEHHCCPRWNRVIKQAVEAVKPKKGKWIEKSEKLAPLNTIWWDECSVCGHHAFNRMITDYCPNCGADMRGYRPWQN